MKNRTRNLLGIVLSLTALASSAMAQQTPSYRVSSAVGGAVTVERDGKRATYEPVFTVIRSDADPQLGLSHFASTPGESLEGVNVENYPLPRWRSASGGGMTDIVYEAGAVTQVRATGSRALDGGGVAWTFASDDLHKKEATLIHRCGRVLNSSRPRCNCATMPGPSAELRIGVGSDHSEDRLVRRPLAVSLNGHSTTGCRTDSIGRRLLRHGAACQRSQ